MPTNGTANCCCQSKTLKHPENTAERKTMRRWRKTRTGNYVFNTRRRFLRAAERYPSKICDGITKWMQNRFEPVEWPTRNEIRCECEDSCMPPGPLPPPFAGEHFSFKSISFRNARYFVVVRSRVRVSFRNPSRNPIDLSRTHRRYCAEGNEHDFNRIVRWAEDFSVDWFLNMEIRFNYLILSVLLGHRLLLCLPLALVSVVLKPYFHLQQRRGCYSSV